jgi:hypothetical protein
MRTPEFLCASRVRDLVTSEKKPERLEGNIGILSKAAFHTDVCPRSFRKTQFVDKAPKALSSFPCKISGYLNRNVMIQSFARDQRHHRDL